MDQNRQNEQNQQDQQDQQGNNQDNNQRRNPFGPPPGGNHDNRGNRENGGMPPLGNMRARIGLVIVGVCILALLLWPGDEFSNARRTSYDTFKDSVESGSVQSVVIVGEKQITYTTMSGEQLTTKIPVPDNQLLSELAAKNITVEGKDPSISMFELIISFLPIILMFFLVVFMLRRMQGAQGGAMGFGKSRARQYRDEGLKLTFKDVAGQKEAKFELEEVVDFLKDSKKFTDIGAKIPRGVLLVGMPGTGKTLLAKAVAGEAGVSFFHISGSDFVEMFVGVGASRVRDLFNQARQNSPCIIFIDELDAVGRVRGSGIGGGNDEREQTLNQMLVEMDGFDTRDEVIVIAATNRPDVLDPALMRPGRFDRQVVVDMPDVEERSAILKIHGAKVKIGKDVDYHRIARATPGNSGADLANLVNEAALQAARGGSKTVCMEHFEEARDKLLLGLARKSKVQTEEERYQTAYHEGGHALLHYYLKHVDPLHKVTIVPRGQALGVAYSLPEKDTYSHTSSWIEDRIKVTMGGYVAEQLFYGETSTGVAADIKAASDLARKMVTELGMSDLGFVSFGRGEEPIFIGREIATHKDYSDETATRIDLEVEKIITRCMNEVKDILTAHKDELQKIADALVERETLEDNDVRALIGLDPRESVLTLVDKDTNEDTSAGQDESSATKGEAHEPAQSKGP